MYKTITYPFKQKWRTTQFDVKKELYYRLNKSTTQINITSTNPLNTGVKPDQVTPLLESIKKSWIDIYSVNQLERLYEEWCVMYPNCDIPDWKMYVDMGSLEATAVLKSDFFRIGD